MWELKRQKSHEAMHRILENIDEISVGNKTYTQHEIGMIIDGGIVIDDKAHLRDIEIKLQETIWSEFRMLWEDWKVNSHLVRQFDSRTLEVRSEVRDRVDFMREDLLPHVLSNLDSIWSQINNLTKNILDFINLISINQIPEKSKIYIDIIINKYSHSWNANNINIVIDMINSYKEKNKYYLVKSSSWNWFIRINIDTLVERLENYKTSTEQLISNYKKNEELIISHYHERYINNFDMLVRSMIYRNKIQVNNVTSNIEIETRLKSEASEYQVFSMEFLEWNIHNNRRSIIIKRLNKDYKKRIARSLTRLDSVH